MINIFDQVDSIFCDINLDKFLSVYKKIDKEDWRKVFYTKEYMPTGELDEMELDTWINVCDKNNILIRNKNVTDGVYLTI